MIESRRPEEHLDVAELERFLDGLLSDEETARVKDHVAVCQRCRLELAMVARFREVDADSELEEEARWQRASQRLDKWAKDWVKAKYRAAVHAEEERVLAGKGHKRTWNFAAVKWLAPAAALAIVVFLLFTIETPPQEKFLENGTVVRGSSVEKHSIELIAPLGEVSSLPDTFKWRTKENVDYFSIDIFTSNLESVVTVPEIKATCWPMPDSLKGRIEHGTIYIWNLKGFKELERSASSQNGWFRLVEGK